MRRLAFVCVALLLISGCGAINRYLAGSDNSLPPADLVPIDDPIAIQELWNKRVGSGTEGNFISLKPVVAEGAVFAASYDGIVSALDADSGAELWEKDTDLDITAGVGVGDGLVLVGTGDGVVLALAQSNGEERWRAQVSSEILATPRSASGVVVVRTGDGKFTGLDARSGERLWVYSHTVPALTLRGAAAPLLDQNVAVAGLDTGKLLVLSLRDGKLVWEKTIAPPQGRTELDRLVDIDTEPRVVNGVLFVAAYQGNITAIDIRSGNTLWTRDFSSHAGLDADTSGIYIVDENDSVWAIDLHNGNALWQQPELKGRRLSAPVISDDYVVVGDFEGYLHWLRKDNGRIVGRVRADSDGLKEAPISRNGRLYVLGEGGRLSVFQLGNG
ncbi:MAG: outer membrane protein assembly factor BamB [Gammaproteobacteria bacterium]|nr:outer membrane protein assembly factor BamB [Gammaproteobacteria bacterium]MCP5458499.1 outer membrane protein assembly factor BamB [Gammaproteobacteria bacterium]